MKNVIAITATLFTVFFASLSVGQGLIPIEKLTFINNSNDVSTVMVQSGDFAETCATSIPFAADAYTSPHTTKSFDENKIVVMCGNILNDANPCRADIYLGGESCDEEDGEIRIATVAMYPYEIKIENLFYEDQYEILIDRTPDSSGLGTTEFKITLNEKNSKN